MRSNTLFVVSLVLAVQWASATEFSVTNQCSETIWFTNQKNSNSGPLGSPDNVQLGTGQQYTYQVPSAGWAGRLWPKVGCDSTGNNCVFGQSIPPCGTGGCDPPADTKVEFNFPASGSSSQSWYDISLVDGYSQAIRVTPRQSPSGGCVPTLCALSFTSCPSNEIDGLGDLAVYHNRQKVACLSPCKRWNFPPPYGLGKNEDQAPGVYMCCPTPPISPTQCRSGPVVNTDYVKLVHSQCPSAYSYAYDDQAGLHNCPGDTSYDIVLCP